MSRHAANADGATIDHNAGRTPHQSSGPIRLMILNQPQAAVLAAFGLILVVVICTSGSKSGRQPAWSRSTGHSGGVWAVAFSVDGRRLAAGRDDGTVALWEMTGTGEAMELADDCLRSVACLAFSPDGMTLAVSYLDFTIGIWDVATRKRRYTISTQSDQVHSLAFSPDGKTLASGGEQRSIRLWKVATGRMRASGFSHCGSVGAIRFHPNARILASGCSRGLVKLWEISDDTIRERVGERLHVGPVLCVAFSPDGSSLASVGATDDVKIMDLDGAQRRTSLSREDQTCQALAFAPDGKSLLLATCQGAVHLSDPTGRPPRSVLPGQFPAYCSAFSSDGRFVVTGGPDGVVRMWDLAREVGKSQ
jgi:WD40 repeat protein